MKKIITIILFGIFFINNTFAYMPINSGDIIIGKIENVNEFNNKVNGKGYEFKFINYINYKIKNNIEDVLNYKNNLLNRKKVIFQNQLPNKSFLKNGDIIAISKYSGGDGVLKIGCEKKGIYIEGIKNKVFLSVFENGKNKIFINDVDKYSKGIELSILKKINKKVGGCEGLKNFFEKDKTLEDLDGKKIKKYNYFGIGFLIIIFIFGFILLRKLLGKK